MFARDHEEVKMKKRTEEQQHSSKEAESSGRKAYHPPKLTIYGDFRRLTRIKGAVDKDSAGGALRTRVAGGSHP